MTLLILGTAFLAARTISTVLPSGKAYSALAVALAAFSAPIAGFAVGVLMAYAMPGEIVSEVMMDSMAISLIAIVAAPIIAFYFRRRLSV